MSTPILPNESDDADIGRIDGSLANTGGIISVQANGSFAVLSPSSNLHISLAPAASILDASAPTVIDELTELTDVEVVEEVDGAVPQFNANTGEYDIKPLEVDGGEFA